jgi:hypothetical protein
VKSPPPENFSTVPNDSAGNPLYVANGKPSVDFYLDWLADYLHRPSPEMPVSALLSLEAAWHKVIVIEIEIADHFYQHPFQEYPPENCKPRHWDFLHRVELSKILSRVQTHSDRRELLYRLYLELTRDSTK